MAKISLNKLNLDKTTKITTININGQEVEVLSYLPLKEKLDIIQISINESLVGTYVNPALVDALFHTYMVLSYTNITLTPTQKENLDETYDLLEKSGLISEVIAAIPSEEYSCIKDSLYECIVAAEKEANSIVTLIKNASEGITDALDSAREQMAGIDMNSDNIQTILKIAKDNGAI